MKQNGPREFYWGTLLPMSVLAGLGTAVIVAVLSSWLAGIEVGGLLRVAGITLGANLVLVLPMQYYVVRTRLERPLAQLEAELSGDLPWQPLGDVLFASLRRRAERVRTAAQETRARAEGDEQTISELRERLQERAAGDAFVLKVAESLRGTEPLHQFAPEMAQLLRSVWPAEEVVLLQLLDTETDLRVLLYEAESSEAESTEAKGSETKAGQVPSEEPRWRKASMVTPLKEALRRGFYEETGLPFSQDSVFPSARSFVAVGLEHRGATVGVLYAVTSVLTPPPASMLHKAQPLFSMAFSRALYRLEMEEAAIRDALSSAYTQDHFLALTRRELSRSNRYSRPVSCAVFDVDYLRRVNDSQGVQGGDRLITEVARVVNGTIRSSDVLARITGGEFAVLLPETGDTAAATAAERIRSAVEGHPFLLQNNRVERVTVSVGIATHPPHGITAIELSDAARAAMVQAKAAGRNQVAAAPSD